MIPQHVLDVLNTLSPAQRNKFQELCMWAGNSGVPSTQLPINYDSLLEMVKTMGEAPVTPIEAPKVIDHELFERMKNTRGG